MGKERNGTWKTIARILGACLICFVGWFGNVVWSKQEETSRTNTQQDVSMVALRDNIIATEKVVMSLEREFRDFREERRQKDSILQDVSFKINLMFDGR